MGQGKCHKIKLAVNPYPPKALVNASNMVTECQDIDYMRGITMKTALSGKATMGSSR